MDKLLQWHRLQSICNAEEASSPALALTDAGKSKLQEMKWLFTAASSILRRYHYGHTGKVIHMPAVFP